MRNIKRLLLICLIVKSICVFGDGLPDGGPYTETVDGISWVYRIEHGSAILGLGYFRSAMANFSGGDIVIPSTLGGRNVVSVGYASFASFQNLTGVEIPEGVTNIDSWAFSNCRSLKKVSIPGSVLEIGWGAFNACINLSSVVIGEGVERICSQAFLDCSSLSSLSLPYGLHAIESQSFEGCVALSSLRIPEGVNKMQFRAFSGCTNLAFVTLPTSLENFETLAFKGCDSLSEIDVAADNRFYCSVDGVVYSKNKTQVVACPPGRSGDYEILESVTEIRDAAFRGCKKLTSIKIPARVWNIGDGAFNECEKLTSISIPSNVCWLGISPFQGCCGLMDFCVSEDNKTYKSMGGLLLDRSGSIVYSCAGGVTSVVVPDGVAAIQDSAFSGCRNLKSVILPPSITYLGCSAFYDCSSLVAVTIPIGVTSIGERTFYGCASLTDVELPVGLLSIERQAFGECKNLTEIKIPDRVSEIGCAAFGGSGLIDVSIPEGVDYIADSAFGWCDALESVSIPNSVTSIGEQAFLDCCSLVSVEIPISVTNIGIHAFSSCDKLASVTIPDGVTEVGPAAFYDCKTLTSVKIGKDVEKIGERAFGYCWMLSSVQFEGKPPAGLADADIRCTSIIRYNVAYEDEWLPVIAECGFTKAIPYVPEPEGTVLFVAPNGDVSERAHVYTNATYGLLPEARREGCAFAGWYTSLDGTNRVSAFSAVDPNVTTLFARWVEDDASLYAQWSANAYSVNFNANGGSGSMTAQPFLYDQMQSLSDNVFTKLGYTFKGWSTSPEGDVVYSDGASVSNLTAEAGYAVALFARWEKIIDVETEEIEDWVAYELAPKFKRSDETKSAYRKRFEEKFGEDYEVAFFSETGKVGMDGTRLCVWHDYVAGTDPLDEKSQFTATIAIDPDTGKPTIDWSPNLGATERRYTLHGKTNLQDTEWHVVNGDEEKYRFFKVTVEMP